MTGDADIPRGTGYVAYRNLIGGEQLLADHELTLFMIDPGTLF
jgi:hypothetical protein